MAAMRALQAAIAAGAADDERGPCCRRCAARAFSPVTSMLHSPRRAAELDQSDTADRRIDYALLLLAAKREAQAREQLMPLLERPETAPEALRLLGLIEFQDGDDAAADNIFSR